MPEDDLAGIEGGLYVDETLVGGTAEQQVWIAEALDVRTVDEDVKL